MSETFLRLNQVLARTALSRSVLFRMVAAKQFPAPRRLRDARISVWLASDIDGWMAGQSQPE